MEQIVLIEKYVHGQLKGNQLRRFEKRLEKDQSIRKRISLFKQIEDYVPLMLSIEEAEQEMQQTGMDEMTEEMVNDWMTAKGDKKHSENLMNFVSL